MIDFPSESVWDRTANGYTGAFRFKWEADDYVQFLKERGLAAHTVAVDSKG